jgi:hypothetical protein
MPAGIPGDLTRREHCKVEQQQMDPNYPCLFFGIPVKMVSGLIRPMTAGDTSQPYGFLVRPFPTQRQTNEILGVATPDPTQICDVMVSGYMTVKVYEGTPAKNGAVYYRGQAGSPAGNLGQLETDSSGSPTINTAITNCRFMGTFDANGFGEIAFNV